MLKKGEEKMIHKMIKEGLGKSAIARKPGLSRDTVLKMPNYQKDIFL